MFLGGRGSKSSSSGSKITPNNMSFAERVYRARWSWEKGLTQNERYAISVSDAPKLERETEKAVQVSWTSDFGTIKKWIPKSVISDEAMNRSLEYEKQRQQQKQAGKDKYDRLVKFAKDNKVAGVRDRMKKSTIIKKIKQAGITIPENLK